MLLNDGWRVQEFTRGSKEGNHISSSAICPDSLSRLVLMKSHLSQACLYSISLCLIVLILSMALSAAWGLWVYVKLSLSICVCHRVHQFFINLTSVCMVQYTPDYWLQCRTFCDAIFLLFQTGPMYILYCPCKQQDINQ